MTDRAHRRLTKNEQTHMAQRMERVAESLYNFDSTLGRLLYAAHKSAASEERSHRSFGRRLVGDIGTRLSVTHTAWLFVARAFFASDYGALYTVEGLATMREDYRNALLARAYAQTRPKVYGSKEPNEQTLYQHGVEIFNVPLPAKSAKEALYGVEGISVWDYSRDVAGN